MNEVMDQIIESLAFEIEAVPNKNKGHMSNGDPINVKIRIRKKDQNKVLQQGVISIPNKDNPMYSNEKIQLSNSDQTIMSFNVLMEQNEATYKQKHKRKFRFFKRGSCLGNQTEEDNYEFAQRGDRDSEQRVQLKSTSINDMNKRNFTLTKMYGSSDARRMEKRTHKDILGECKPGGCLDPPYGEDKYSYVPKLIQMSKMNKNSSKRNSNEIAYQKPSNKKTDINGKDEISNVSDKKDQLPFPPNINLSNTKRSNSIITYPSTSSNESLNKNIQKSVQYNNNNTRISHTSNENVDTYFISPKKIKINNLQEKSIGFTEFGAEKQSLLKLLSQDQNDLNQLEPEILENYENTHPEGNIVDTKMTILSNKESFEKVDIKLTTRISSLADLSNNARNSPDVTKNEVITKCSLTSLIDTINTDSLKISLDPIRSSESPKILYKVNSDTAISCTKNSVVQIEYNEQITSNNSGSETFTQDQNLVLTKLDNGIDIKGKEKENVYKENGDVLEPECPVENEYVKLINLFSSVKSLISNQSFNTQNENKNEITNITTESIIPNALIFDEKSISKLSIVDNDLAQNKKSTTIIQDLNKPLSIINPTITSDFANVDINNRVSLTDKDNESSSEQKYERNLLDDKIDSNISSNDVNIAGIQEIETKISLLTFNNDKQNTTINSNKIDSTILSNDSINIAKIREIESKSSSLTVKNDKQNSILSNYSNRAPMDNKGDDGYNNFTTENDLKESNNMLLIVDDNDLKYTEKINTDNFVINDTSTRKSTIRSVKSDIEHSALFNNFVDSEFEKRHSSPRLPQSLTSMEKQLNRYNTLNDLVISEPKHIDLARDPDTGLGDSMNTEITETIKSNEAIEIFSLVKDNLEREDSLIKKSKSETNVSLSINDDVKLTTPLEQFINDKSEAHTQLVSNDATNTYKNEHGIKLNEVLSTNEGFIQSSQETKVKPNEENFKDDTKSGISKFTTDDVVLKISKDELSPISGIEVSKNDELSDFQETPITVIDSDSGKKHSSDFIHPLSKKGYSKDIVYLNMAFQSFYSERDGNVIRTIEARNNDVERYEDDNILQFMTLARLDDVPISIPIDTEKKIVLQIAKTKEIEDRKQEITEKDSILTKKDPKHKIVEFDADNGDPFANTDLDNKNVRNGSKKGITSNTKSEGNLKLTLDNVYTQKLLPLHNTIKDLKSYIDGLLKQQLIKDKLHNDKRTNTKVQIHRIHNNFKICCCNEQLLKH